MYNLLSYREKEPLPLQFDHVSEKCRNQIVTVFYRIISDERLDPDYIYEEIRMNLGLKPVSYDSLFDDSISDIVKGLDNSQFKDLIDLMCQIFYDIYSKNKYFDYSAFSEDINDILIKNGLGYKVQNGILIKCMDDYEFNRIIEPGFEILYSNGFDQSRDYLLSSFESYKNGNNSSALIEATKALEATIDRLAILLDVSLDKKDKITVKLTKLLDNGLCPKYNESFFNTLVKLLSEATARNMEGAHAKTDSIYVSDHIVQYALDQTMSSILFLVRCYIESKK